MLHLFALQAALSLSAAALPPAGPSSHARPGSPDSLGSLHFEARGTTALSASSALDSDRKADRRARRVIRTTSGGVLRGVARRGEDGVWQIKGKRGWVDVPDAAIENIALEKELLSELSTREEAMQKGGAEETPAALLGWAFEVGLLKEAFALGDRLLDASPRDSELRLACTRAARYVAGMPERGADGELDALREVGGRGSAIVREAIVERLITVGSRADVLAGLQSDLKSKAHGRRTFAAFALGRVFPSEDPRPLLLHAMWDPAKDARVEAARAVGQIGALEVGGPLVRALSAKAPETRIRAAEALGYAQDNAFATPLMDRLYMLASPAAAGGGSAGRPPHGYIFIGTQTAYVQDFDVEVASGSSVADPVINTLLQGAVLDAGVIGVDIITVKQELRVVRSALRRITGQTPGSRSKDWIRWWENDPSAKSFHSKAEAAESPRYDLRSGKRR